MPYGDPDPGDPHALVGVSLEGTAESTRQMVAAFADEFARMGYGRERILSLFRTPFYAGAHAAYGALGEAEVARIVGESVGFWGRLRHRVEDAPEGPVAEGGGVNAFAKWSGGAGPRRAA